MAFLPPPPPKSGLGYYRLLSPTASVRVSPLCLGAMNFGDSWRDLFGECTKENSFAMMDYFYEQGGNFIDTANNYQKGESEQWVGEWMEKRGVREQIVLATKYSSPLRAGHGDKEIIINTGGNGGKSLRASVKKSLENLKTDYIDLLYVHWWDFTTSVEELMLELNDLVTSGKVIYLGISDTPAWIVAKCNQYARDHGLRQFAVYQGNYSAAVRDMEREIIPMALAERMGIAPWGALGGGLFKTESQRQAAGGRAVGEVSETVLRMSKKLEEIASKKNTQITSVALAYAMHKYPYVFPIVGGRKIEHLKGNIEALELELSEEEITEIEKESGMKPEFPERVIGKSGEIGWLLGSMGQIDFVQGAKAIPPRKVITGRNDIDKGQA